MQSFSEVNNQRRNYFIELDCFIRKYNKNFALEMGRNNVFLETPCYSVPCIKSASCDYPGVVEN